MKKQLLLVSVLCVVMVWVGCGGAESFVAPAAVVPPAAPGGPPPPVPPPPPAPSLNTFYLYVANRGSSDISKYSFQSDGSNLEGLTSIGSTPVPSPPVAMAFTQIEELSNYVFVATETAQILSYRVDPPTGHLNVVSTVAGHGRPVAFGLFGNILYVANAGTNDVSAFSLDSNGALTPVSGSPFATGLAEVRAMGGHGIQNTFLTVVGNGGVADFPLDASGHLGTPTLTTANVPADIKAITAGPGLVFLLSSTGLHAYVERSVPDSPDCLDAPFDCKLTATPLPVGSQPSSMYFQGDALFVANSGSHDLTAFRVSDDGGLGVSFTPLANTPTGLGPSSFGSFGGDKVLVTNELSNSLSMFRFNTNDNTLTQLNGSPVATGTGPVAVVIP